MQGDLAKNYTPWCLRHKMLKVDIRAMSLTSCRALGLCRSLYAAEVS